MRLTIATVLILFATAAVAQSKRDELKYFAGTWKCTGMAFASEMGPEHATTGTVTIKWILNKQWLDVRYVENKTSKNPHPFAVNAYWGYDSGSKKLVAGAVDVGGGYGTSESTGWEGDTLVFTGPFHAGPMTGTGRDTFTRKGANELMHTGELQDQSGGWKKTDEETCKK